MGKVRKYVILCRQPPAPDIEAFIRSQPYPESDDYIEVRRDERERMTTIPDHVRREAIQLLNKDTRPGAWCWPDDHTAPAVITVAKLLMNPPAPMTDPDEEAAKRVIGAWFGETTMQKCNFGPSANLTRATEQMCKEREAWEAGQP